MAVPHFSQMILPALRLAAREEIDTEAVVRAVAQEFNLTDEDVNELLTKGKSKQTRATRATNMASWAIVHLQEEKLIQRIRVGPNAYTITDRGRDFLAKNPANFGIAESQDDDHGNLQRGAEPANLSDPDEEADIFGFEGELRNWFIKTHRKREARLRKKKIAEVLKKNHGRLACEVPNCGFNFVERYGEIGTGFAQVHHKTPLGKARDKGRNVLLSELVVVCPNCHAMIHIGGECRSIETLSALISR